MDEAPGTGGGSNDGADIHWEQDSDDILTVAKLEPLDDDDIRLDDLKEAPLSALPEATDPAATQPKVKRPRGRPRKHPLTPIVTTNKVTKGRSKTGCLTCRKRKKKCDEAKPRCKPHLLLAANHDGMALTNPCRHELREERGRVRGISGEADLEEWQGEGRRRYFTAVPL